MSKIVIKKRINLDFLGDDYKDAYLVFKSIPLPDYESIQDSLPKSDPRYIELVNKAQDGELDDKENAELRELQPKESDNNMKSIRMMLDLLKKYFISGKFPDAETGKLEKLEGADDLDGLDEDAAMRCFKRLTGQEIDPKGEKPLNTPSSMEPSSQTNS